MLGVALLLLSLAVSASGQMQKFDTSEGEWKIECPVRSYCLLRVPGASPPYDPFAWGPTEWMEEDEQRYRGKGLATYYWKDVDEAYPAYLKGNTCRTPDECYAICDNGCVCRKNPDSPEGALGTVDPDSPPCTIIETLPDASVIHPSEMVSYESVAQQPEWVELRCEGEFSLCLNSGDSYFITQKSVAGYDYAMDLTDCSTAPSDPCFVSCDPRCTCGVTMTDGNVTSGGECTIASPPTPEPTPEPTSAPTPALSSAGSTFSAFFNICGTVALISGSILWWLLV